MERERGRARVVAVMVHIGRSRAGGGGVLGRRHTAATGLLGDGGVAPKMRGERRRKWSGQVVVVWRKTVTRTVAACSIGCGGGCSGRGWLHVRKERMEREWGSDGQPNEGK